MNSETSPVTPLQAVDERPSIEDLATSFYVHIAHGDEKHRAWLKAETFAWFRGRAHLLQAEMQKPDQVHFAANGDEAKSLQPLLDAPLTEGDLTAINRVAENYASLMERWKSARAYSQETANLHASFKAEERTLGKLAEDGLFTRIAAALGNRTPARQEERSSEKEVGAAPLPVQGQEAVHPNHLPDLRYVLRVLESIQTSALPRFRAADVAHGEVAAAINGMRYVIKRTEEAAALRASSAPTTKQGD